MEKNKGTGHLNNVPVSHDKRGLGRKTEAVPREIKNYQTKEGREPFAEWLIHLKDIGAKVAIAKRLERVQLGNFGDCEPVGEGILELKFHVGPGYRVYLGQDGRVLIILLHGGEKHTQKRRYKTCKGMLGRLQVT